MQVILQEDDSLREIREEYEEMCAWLASQQQSSSRPPQIYDDAGDLIRATLGIQLS